jgi:type IV secretory pathway VirB3-like protein
MLQNDEYSAKVFQSLSEPIRIAGLPRNAAIALWGLATGIFAVHMTIRNLWVFPAAFLLHALFALLTRNDPDFLLVFLRALLAPPLFLGRTRLLARERRLISCFGWTLYLGRRLEP